LQLNEDYYYYIMQIYEQSLKALEKWGKISTQLFKELLNE